MFHENEYLHEIATPRVADASRSPLVGPFAHPEALLRDSLGIPPRRIHPAIFSPQLRRRGQEALIGLRAFARMQLVPTKMRRESV